MGFWSKFKKLPLVNLVFDDDSWVTVRNRDEKGRYVADDKSTPDIDESLIQVKDNAKGKFKDTDPVAPGVQNTTKKRAVRKKKTATKTTAKK